jgi:hypothetical protein
MTGQTTATQAEDSEREKTGSLADWQFKTRTRAVRIDLIPRLKDG